MVLNCGVDWNAPYCRKCNLKLPLQWRVYGCSTPECPNLGKELDETDVFWPTPEGAPKRVEDSIVRVSKGRRDS